MKNGGQYYKKMNLLLLSVDLLCMLLSYVLSLAIRLGSVLYVPQIHPILLVIQTAVYLTTCIALDIYQDIYRRGYYKEFRNVLEVNGILAAVTFAVLFFTKNSSGYSRMICILFFVFNVTFTYICRVVVKKWALPYYRHGSASQKIMVVATQDRVVEVLQNLIRKKDGSYYINSVAILDADLRGETIMGVPVCGDRDGMYDAAMRDVVDAVILDLPYGTSGLTEMLEKFGSMGVTIYLLLDQQLLGLPNVGIGQVGGYVAATSQVRVLSTRQVFAKRAMDILGGLAGLAITVILTVILGPAIKLESSGPVFFSQERVGKNGRIFRIYKFRSMCADAEEKKKELEQKNKIQGLMFKMDDDPRITKVGKFIRKTSLDEFPQFWNVLKGDMSLVGTRPPTVDEFQKYELHHKKRLSMKPGLTGLWQVSGRSDITDFEEVVKLDTKYIEEWNLGLDVKIILKTVGLIFSGQGAE